MLHKHGCSTWKRQGIEIPHIPACLAIMLTVTTVQSVCVCVLDRSQMHCMMMMIPPWQQKIFSSTIAATGKQLKQSVKVFHSFTLYRLLPVGGNHNNSHNLILRHIKSQPAAPIASHWKNSVLYNLGSLKSKEEHVIIH